MGPLIFVDILILSIEHSQSNTGLHCLHRRAPTAYFVLTVRLFLRAKVARSGQEFL